MKSSVLVQKHLQQGTDKGSFLSQVSIPRPPIAELDDLSAQEARDYLDQRKHFDRALQQSNNELQKLACL